MENDSKKQAEIINNSSEKLLLSDVSLLSGQLVCRLHSMRKNCREYRYNKKYCKTCPHNIRQTN